MSDQNQFDQYKQKLLHYWSLFLAACGRFWEQVKVHTKKAAQVASTYAVAFGQMLVEFAKAAGRWLKKAWEILLRYAKIAGQWLNKAWEILLRYAKIAGQWLKKGWEVLKRYARRLLQILAAWLLLAKEKSEPVIGKCKEWLVPLKARFRKPEQLPAPEAAEVPALEEPAIAAEPVQLVETAMEPPEEAPAEAAPAKEPAWKSNPWMVKTAAVFAAIGVGMRFLGKWIRRLYKFVMAAPVVWAAIKFAMENMERLPEEVGLDIQSTGEFARMITRNQAVYWPLGITMFCLLLMFCAKKPILPWVISIFTLVLPWLIWLLNYYA